MTSRPEPGHLLIVDDNKVNRILLARGLEGYGHKVEAVDNGRLALEKLRSNTYDLVLLDIETPEMDGYQVLETCLQDPDLRDIPIIMTSSLDEINSVVKCIELGAEDYLNKPVNPSCCAPVSMPAWRRTLGLRGPLEGRSLPKLPSTLTTWGRWRTLHPQTSVFLDPRLPGRRRFTEETVSRITQAGGGPARNEDLVVAVEGKAGSRAYLLRRLAEERVVNDRFEDRPIAVFLAEDAVTARAMRREVAGRTLTLATLPGDRLKDSETGTTWDALTGRGLEGPLQGRTLEELVLTPALWYAWRSHRPGATLWGEPGR